MRWTLTGQLASSHLEMHELWKLWLHTVVKMPLMWSSSRSAPGENNRVRCDAGVRPGSRVGEAALAT